ncbi:hypothetical protein BC2230_60222 [Burkholderia cepacia]
MPGAARRARNTRAARLTGWLTSGLSFLPDGRIDSTPGGLCGPPGTFVFWRVLHEPSADGRSARRVERLYCGRKEPPRARCVAAQ